MEAIHSSRHDTVPTQYSQMYNWEAYETSHLPHFVNPQDVFTLPSPPYDSTLLSAEVQAVDGDFLAYHDNSQGMNTSSTLPEGSSWATDAEFDYFEAFPCTPQTFSASDSILSAYLESRSSSLHPVPPIPSSSASSSPSTQSASCESRESPTDISKKRPLLSLRCPQCSKHFSQNHKYNKHLKTHNRDFTCSVADCNAKGFYRPRDLHRHVPSRHSDGTSNRYFCTFSDCEYATRGFVRNDNCLRHIREQHESARD